MICRLFSIRQSRIKVVEPGNVITDPSTQPYSLEQQSPAFSLGVQSRQSRATPFVNTKFIFLSSWVEELHKRIDAEPSLDLV